jgi:hypothetical protein
MLRSVVPPTHCLGTCPRAGVALQPSSGEMAGAGTPNYANSSACRDCSRGLALLWVAKRRNGSPHARGDSLTWCSMVFPRRAGPLVKLAQGLGPRRRNRVTALVFATLPAWQPSKRRGCPGLIQDGRLSLSGVVSDDLTPNASAADAQAADAAHSSVHLLSLRAAPPLGIVGASVLPAGCESEAAQASHPPQTLGVAALDRSCRPPWSPCMQWLRPSRRSGAQPESWLADASLCQALHRHARITGARQPCRRPLMRARVQSGCRCVVSSPFRTSGARKQVPATSRLTQPPRGAVSAGGTRDAFSLCQARQVPDQPTAPKPCLWKMGADLGPCP